MKQCECATKVKAKSATIEMKRALPLSLCLPLSLSVSVLLSNGDSKWQLSSADGVAQIFVWLSADCAATSTLRESNKNWTKRNWNWNQSCLECCGMWNTRCCVRFPVVLATRSSLCRSKRATERERATEWERDVLCCFIFIRFVAIGKSYCELPIMEAHVLSRSRTRLDSKQNGACFH